MQPLDEMPQIRRIADIVLSDAARDNADAISVCNTGRGVSVQYLVSGDWRSQFKIPEYVWAPLLSHWRRMAGLLDDNAHWGSMEVVVNEFPRLLNLSHDGGSKTILLEFVGGR